jgi:hypothetical protein
MCRDRPALAIAFYQYLLCSLSDRLVLTDRVVAALTLGEPDSTRPNLPPA